MKATYELCKKVEVKLRDQEQLLNKKRGFALIYKSCDRQSSQTLSNISTTLNNSYINKQVDLLVSLIHHKLTANQ